MNYKELFKLVVLAILTIALTVILDAIGAAKYLILSIASFVVGICIVLLVLSKEFDLWKKE